MSSSESHPNLDFTDNTVLRIVHEASLEDLLRARNYATLHLLKERNTLLREREELSGIKMEFRNNAFITPPNPDALLPYTLLPPSPCTVMPLRASRPRCTYNPAKRDASTQTDNGDNNPNTRSIEIEPAVLCMEVQPTVQDKKRKLSNKN